VIHLLVDSVGAIALSSVRVRSHQTQGASAEGIHHRTPHLGPSQARSPSHWILALGERTPDRLTVEDIDVFYATFAVGRPRSGHIGVVGRAAAHGGAALRRHPGQPVADRRAEDGVVALHRPPTARPPTSSKHASPRPTPALRRRCKPGSRHRSLPWRSATASSNLLIRSPRATSTSVPPLPSWSNRSAPSQPSARPRHDQSAGAAAVPRAR
jgi:hypothetical protein